MRINGSFLRALRVTKENNIRYKIYVNIDISTIMCVGSFLTNHRLGLLWLCVNLRGFLAINTQPQLQYETILFRNYLILDLCRKRVDNKNVQNVQMQCMWYFFNYKSPFATCNSFLITQHLKLIKSLCGVRVNQ